MLDHGEAKIAFAGQKSGILYPCNVKKKSVTTPGLSLLPCSTHARILRELNSQDAFKGRI